LLFHIIVAVVVIVIAAIVGGSEGSDGELNGADERSFNSRAMAKIRAASPMNRATLLVFLESFIYNRGNLS
jgi:ABC-type cobalt transport system substrate-binding protein